MKTGTIVTLSIVATRLQSCVTKGNHFYCLTRNQSYQLIKGKQELAFHLLSCTALGVTPNLVRSTQHGTEGLNMRENIAAGEVCLRKPVFRRSSGPRTVIKIPRKVIGSGEEYVAKRHCNTASQCPHSHHQPDNPSSRVIPIFLSPTP